MLDRLRAGLLYGSMIMLMIYDCDMNTQSLTTNIFDDVGLAGLPTDDKVALLQQMATLVQKQVMLRIMGMLFADDAETLAALIDEKGAESPEVRAFLLERVPNFDELLEEETLKVKQGLAKNAAENQEA